MSVRSAGDGDNIHEMDMLGAAPPYTPRRPRTGAFPSEPRFNPSASSGGPLIVAIDYGTTRTGVAISLGDRIDVIRDWGENMGNEYKVASAISYIHPDHGDLQWGFAIDDDRVAMVNTKLELQDLSSKHQELDVTLNVLKGFGYLSIEHMIIEGPSPAYSPKEPSSIISDYLQNIQRRIQDEVREYNLEATNTPLDMIISAPVDWPYSSINSLFRATQAARFNKRAFPTLRDVLLVSEPEAASYFTARDLRDLGESDFAVNDSFVLADAGGGTVDLASFRVKQLRPELILEKVAEPQGGQCGSTWIDHNFKRWLRKTLGDNVYAQIDPINAWQHDISPNAIESAAMRKLIKKFNLEKNVFSSIHNKDRAIVIDLPAPLNTLTLAPRVQQGALTIKRREMEGFFIPVVDQILTMIKSQVDRCIAETGRRVWNVLLVGGFASSPYLCEKLKVSLSAREQPIDLHVPEDPTQTTAVVRGAAIYAREKARHSDAKHLIPITASYGVEFDDRYHWLIRKGDVALPNNTINSDDFWFVPESSSQLQQKSVIYCHQGRGEHDIGPVNPREGRNEVEEVGAITWDIGTLRSSIALSSSRTRLGPLQWKLQLTDSSSHDIEFVLHSRDRELGRATIRPQTDTAGSTSSPSRNPYRHPWL